MKRKSISNDNKKDNISSRLLGTNVNEINIEKFRDSKPAPQKFRVNGKLNEQILKTISNKFTCDVIFNLDLSFQNLLQIDILEKCPNLVMLNVKGNQIKDLTPLTDCKQLVYLNIQLNQVLYLDPLKNCEKLANLHAEGNKIASVKNLNGLFNCKNLRTVYFKTLSGLDQNPICETRNYKEDVYDSIPSLRRLDGIPKDQELDNGEDLVKDQKEIDFTIDSKSPWYIHQFPKVDVNKEVWISGEDQLKNSLKETKSAISSLEARMKALLA